MDDNFGIIDNDIKDALLRFSTVELVRLVFPGHPVRSRGIMRSPFRVDRNPSFSCFRGRGGYSFWKDHSTGESGDNISFFRKAYPSLSYAEAVEELSVLVLGKSALRSRRDYPVRRNLTPSVSVKTSSVISERESALSVIEARSILDRTVPDCFVGYWRNRGISDEVMAAYDCRYVIYENRNRKGRRLVDSVSGLPILDYNGKEVIDDGRNEAIGIYNDIGGMVLRSPDTDNRKGFKGATSSFIATYLSDGSRPARTVYFSGIGDGTVSSVSINKNLGVIMVNSSQYFSGIQSYALDSAAVFLQGYQGIRLDERDVSGLCAVFSSLNVPVVSDAVVVEGMFDGLSVRELNKGRSVHSECDLVILNSVSNIKWAVPFLCRHDRVTLMLDNDLSSGAGHKAADELMRAVSSFAAKTGSTALVYDGSRVFEGYNDLNEALMAHKGFPVRRQASMKI